MNTTGEHTLYAWMREDGLRVDRVLLVTDTNYIPSGLGPAESPFQTITDTIPGGLGTTSITYNYDALYRLTGATYSGAITASFEYVYDSVGNMTAFTETVDAQTTNVSRTFDAANRLQTSFDGTAGTTSYIYDANGNLTEVYPPGSDAQNPVGVLRYAYDQRNLMVSHETNPDGTAWFLRAEYVYDGTNDRLQQIDYTGATPITTTYVNDVFGLTQVLVADDGTTQVYNLFGLDLISQDSGSEVRTLLVDGLGSVRLEMVGSLVETATTYSPYGEVLEQTGTSGTVYGFTGEQEDGATGLLYLRARYYNSSLKTFMSRDPWEGTGLRPATLNYYTYAHANPINLVDPSGKVVCLRRNKDGECILPAGPQFKPRELGNRVVGATADLLCSVLGLCKVENGVLQPLTDAQYAEACVGNLMGLANPIGMVSIPGASLGGDAASEALQKLARDFAEKFAGKPGVEQVLRELEIGGTRRLGAEWQMRYALEKLNVDEVVGFELAGTVGRVDIVVQQGKRITFIEAKHINWYALEQLRRTGVRAQGIVEQVLGHAEGQDVFSKVVVESVGAVPEWFKPLLEDAGIVVRVFAR